MVAPTAVAPLVPAVDPGAVLPAGRHVSRRREPLLDVVGADLQVPLVDGSTTRYVNLDNAASSPALRAVADCVADVLPYYASVHRGAGYASQVSTGLYEQARRQVARFVGARDDDVTVFTRNTTDAINLLARCVPRGHDVVVLDIEHHANLLPWQDRGHRIVPAEATWAETLAALGRSLAHRSAALVAVTGSSNVTGEVVAVDQVAALAHAFGARVLVDAAQLAPHRHVDLAASGIDYLALSGHKLYAPFGAGVLVGRRDWLDAGPPHLAGGGAVTRVDVGHAEWACAPQRHEGGTPNVLGAVALAAACEVIEAVGHGALTAHEHDLDAHLRDGLTTVPGVRVARLWPDSADRLGVVTFAVEGQAPDLVAAALSAEHGIGVRDGRFCAHPLLTRLGHPGGALRASIGVGTRSADIERLINALGELTTTGPRWSYEIVDGRPAPADDPRPADPWGAIAAVEGATVAWCGEGRR